MEKLIKETATLDRSDSSATMQLAIIKRWQKIDPERRSFSSADLNAFEAAEMEGGVALKNFVESQKEDLSVYYEELNARARRSVDNIDQELYRVCLHEMGHVFACLLLNIPFDGVRTLPNYTGEVYGIVVRSNWHNDIISLAGHVAERLFLGDADRNRSNFDFSLVKREWEADSNIRDIESSFSDYKISSDLKFLARLLMIRGNLTREEIKGYAG